MANEIVPKCADLRITDDESKVVSFDEVPNDNEDSGISLSLVGKVVTIRPYNFEAMKQTMNQIYG